MFVLCIFSFYWELMSSVCRDEKFARYFAFTFHRGWNSCTNLVSCLFLSFIFFFFYNFVWFRSKKNSIKKRKDIKLKISFVFDFRMIACHVSLVFDLSIIDRSWNKGTLQQQQYNPFHDSSYIAFFFVTWMNCSLNFC